MEDKNKLKSEIIDINKQINSTSNHIYLQNQKIHEINERLETIDEKTKVTNKYTSGFNSIFGFLPKIFSWGKKNKTVKEEVNKINEAEKVGTTEKEVISDDELEKEIKMLSRNAKKLNENITHNLSSTDKLNNKIDGTIQNVNKAMLNEKKVLNKK